MGACKNVYEVKSRGDSGDRHTIISICVTGFIDRLSSSGGLTALDPSKVRDCWFSLSAQHFSNVFALSSHPEAR